MTILGKSGNKDVNIQKLRGRIAYRLTEDETWLVIRHEAGLRVHWRLRVRETASRGHLPLFLHHLCHYYY